MRQVLSISLPATAVKQIKKTTKKRGFPSVSAYIQTLVGENETEEHLISEDELLEAIREAEEEYRAGRTIKVNSMRDLL